jgi:enoyl-CoA hydratase
MVTKLGLDPEVRVVVLRAEGRGFNAGVDIKEMQRTQGFDALLGANKGCFEAFKAVYECKVPVISAVHGYCLGGGIGLVGNSDVIVASEDATFGLPEVDRGALGAATHLARLVPEKRLRHMVYTCEPVTAEELQHYGSVCQVVERGELLETARTLAAGLARKDPRVMRAAKQALCGIDPVDVKKSYRFEQGFTFELDIAGAGGEARGAFLSRRRDNVRMPELADQADVDLLAEDEVEHLLGVARANADADARVADGEPLEDPRQDVGGDGGSGAQRQPAGASSLEGVHDPAAVRDALERLDGVGEEGVARLGELHPARRPDEERRAQVGLELFQARGERGLGDEQPVRRPADGSDPRDLDEGLELRQKHRSFL